MPGSLVAQIRPHSHFSQSVDRFCRDHYKKARKDEDKFRNLIADLVLKLFEEPRGCGSWMEPWPKNSEIPHLEFRKLTFKPPGLKGAAGEGRLMYAINHESRTLSPFWVYSHSQFTRRPSDSVLRDLLQGLK